MLALSTSSSGTLLTVDPKRAALDNVGRHPRGFRPNMAPGTGVVFGVSCPGEVKSPKDVAMVFRDRSRPLEAATGDMEADLS